MHVKIIAMTLVILFALTPTSIGQELNYNLLWVYEVGDMYWAGPSVSSDGSYIAVGDFDGTIYFLNSEGKLLWSDGIENGVTSCSVSSDGSYIAAGSHMTSGKSNSAVYFFDQNGKLLWSYETTTNYVGDLSVSSDGSYIAAASSSIYLLDQKGKLLWSYDYEMDDGSWSDFSSVSVSSDGSYIAAGSSGNIYFFNREGELLWRYENDFGGLGDISVSSDGSYIAAGSSDNAVYFFNNEGALLWSYEMDDDVRSVSVSSDGSYVLAGSYHDVYLFNNEGETLWNYKDYIMGASLSSDASVITIGVDENRVCFFVDAEKYANNSINKAKTAVAHADSQGFDMNEAEDLLLQAEQAFSIEDYERSAELAEQALTMGLAMNDDGVSNVFGFAPAINNYYIYAGAAILLIGFAIMFLTLKRKEGWRHREEMKHEIMDIIEKVTKEEW